jgi:hypothetical protein
MPARRPGERLVGLFVLGTVLFSPPFMALASGGRVFGLPGVYLYVFCAWALLIAGLAWVIERRPP